MAGWELTAQRLGEEHQSSAFQLDPPSPPSSISSESTGERGADGTDGAGPRENMELDGDSVAGEPNIGVTVRDDIGVKKGVLGSIRDSTYLTGNIPRRFPLRPSNQFSSTLRINFTRSPFFRESSVDDWPMKL
jgi:hypothetical protein